MSQVTNLVAHQRETFRSGALRKTADRAALLQKLRKAVEKREKALSDALRQDLGKAPFESYETEIGLVLQEIRFALKHLEEWCAPERVKTPLTCLPGSSFLLREPYGVCLILAPWNYPVQLTLLPLVSALAAGNCAVVKPSELTPNVSRQIAQLIEETFDPGIVCCVEGGREETQALLEEPFDLIFFTGSSTVGRVVLRAAAERMTPVVLELGGKSPCIVDESADLELAAKRIAWGKFLNAGQTCVAPDYLFLHQSVAEPFMKRLTHHIKAMWGQKPLENSDYGCIVNQRHFDRLCAYLQEGKVLLGGTSDRERRKIAPTLLTDLPDDASVLQEEIFGPILPVLSYRNIQEVIDFINARPKPLALYLFANYQVTVHQVLREVSFGGGCLNDTVLHLTSPYLPFGGVGESGMGSYHGKQGFDTFSHQKSILKRSNLTDISLRYPPYSDKKMKKIKKHLK